MSYSFATGGSGWQMVPCMATFLAEVADCVKAGLLDVTNLGQIASPQHLRDAPVSRHNPALAPNGVRYVCAADFGGPDYAKLAYFHQTLYRAGDPRVYSHGFSQRGDGYGLSWPDGGWQWTGRDQGHCHFDVTMRNASLSSNWWVDSLASTAPWGLANWLRTGGVTTAPPDSLEDDSMSAAEVADLKAYVKAMFEAYNLEGRANDMEQASKAMRGDVVPQLEALTQKVNDLSDRVQALRTELASKPSD